MSIKNYCVYIFLKFQYLIIPVRTAYKVPWIKV